MRCIECGGAMKTRRENHYYKESGLSGITLVNLEISQCENCGQKEVEIPAIAQLHALIVRSILLKAARLLPEEIRFLRKHVGWSQSDLAARMGVAPETANRWENDKTKMSVPVERYFRLRVATQEPIQHYEREVDHVAVGKPQRSNLRLERDDETWKALKAA
jgi:putative transcriptional regulator